MEKTIGLAYLIGFVGVGLVFLQVSAANVDKFLTVAQMIAKGFTKGLPLLYHAGVWGDFFLINPAVTWIIYAYSDRWGFKDILVSGAVALIASIALVNLWIYLAKVGLPEAHTYGGRLTEAGWYHGIYLWGMLTIFILFFFHSGVTREPAIIVAIILAVHLLYGTHIFLGLYGPEWFTNRPHKDPVTWIVLAISWGALAWRCLTLK